MLKAIWTGSPILQANELSHENLHIGLDNVKTLNSLGISSNPPTHAILIEALPGVTLGYVECIGGFQSLTIKCQRLQGGRAQCYIQYGDAFIIKSDTGAACRSVRMESIDVGLVETAGWPTTITNDGIYDAHDGVGIADIHIGSLSVINTSWVLIPAAINEGATGNTTQVAIGEYFALLVYGNYFSLEIGQ
ncbi:hypothetical protein ACWM56_06100 [Enterobacter roggenkampii]